MKEVSRTLPLDAVRVDGGTQPRAALNPGQVAEYAGDMERGDQFPPVTVFHDGADHWLADGFHRHHAAASLGLGEIAAEVRQGSRRDAVLFSVGANASHGMRRSNDDKRRAVLTLLADPEWAAWSDREIARQCGVSQPFVSGLRPKVPEAPSDNRYQAGEARKVERGGRVYEMSTGGINAGRGPDRDQEPATLPPRDGDPAGGGGERKPGVTESVRRKIAELEELIGRDEARLAADIDPAKRKVTLKEARHLANRLRRLALDLGRQT